MQLISLIIVYISFFRILKYSAILLPNLFLHTACAPGTTWQRTVQEEIWGQLGQILWESKVQDDPWSLLRFPIFRMDIPLWKPAMNRTVLMVLSRRDRPIPVLMISKYGCAEWEEQTYGAFFFKQFNSIVFWYRLCWTKWRENCKKHIDWKMPCSV